jgi:hypothetical protein
MAYLTTAEEGRIWSSLDDNLREKIRRGELTFEEAAKFVVPIGDVRLLEERAKYPTRPVSLDEETPPAGEEWGLGTMIDTNIGRIKQSGSALGATDAALELQTAERAEAVRGQGIIGTLTEKLKAQLPAAARAIADPLNLSPTNAANTAIEGLVGTQKALVETYTEQANANLYSKQENEQRINDARTRLSGYIKELNAGTAYLASLPQNPFSTAAVEAANNGDWVSWGANIIPAALTTMGEQGIELAVAGAVTAGTAYATRNPAATAAAARAASLISSSSEYGSDLAELWEQVPEAERTYEKFQELRQIAAQAASGRALLEAALPGVGAKLGKTAYRRAATELGLQMVAGAAGEDIAQRIKSGRGEDVLERIFSGDGASVGELLLEAAADSAGVAIEAGPSLRNANRADLQDKNAAAYIEQERNRAFAEELAALNNQKLAERNRGVFDAEAEADRLAEGIKMQSAQQMEMPFGSDMTADPQANDRVPTIVDMFSGESKAAPAVQRELDNRVPMDQMPEETDEAFEIRQQRTTNAKIKIEDRKQSQFEDQKLQEFVERDRNERAQQETFEAEQQEKERQRNQLAEDRTILKNERQLLSTADITREARNLLAKEQEGVRRQRQGIARTPEQLDAILKAYERKRLPELIDNVRERRLKQVNEARKREIDRENATVKQDNEKLAAAQALKKFVYEPRTKANEERGIPRVEPDVDSPDYRGSRDRGTLTDLLPGNQLKKAQQYRGRVVDKEYQAQEEFETYSQRYYDGVPQKGTQGELALPDQEDQGNLFGTGGMGNRGLEMTESERKAELARGVERRRTLTKKVEERSQKEKEASTAEIEAEIPTVAKAIAQEQTKQANLTAKKYAKDEQEALNNIVKEELKNAGNRTPDEVKSAVATKLAAWRKANPRPESAPAPQTDLVEQAKTVAKRQEASKKAADTKATNKALAREIARGATPEEAAEIVANQRLSKEEEADLRSELGKKAAPTEKREQINTNGVIDWVENVGLRNIYDDVVSSRSLTKLGDLLNRMATSDDVSPEGKWLAERLAPLASRLGIDLDDSQPAGSETVYGWFSPESNIAGINRTDEETILHEALHAVTSRMLLSRAMASDPTVQRARAELEAVLQAAKAAYEKNPYAVSSELRKIMNGSQGPLTNVRELISFGLTHKPFVTWLSGIPMPGQKKSLWQGFKDAISKFLKPQTAAQRTAVDSIIEATNNLIGLQEGNLATNAMAGASINNRGRFEPMSAVTGEAEFTNPRTRENFTNLGPLSIRPEWKNKKTIGGAIVDAFSSGAGGLKVSTEIFDRAQSDTAALIYRAEKLYGMIDSALEAQAPQTKEGIEAYRQQFIEDITAFENEDSRLTKAQMARNIRKTYGQAGRSYFAMRRTIDSLSRDILQQRLTDPRPFTNAEAKIYRSIRDNIGKYYTRVYAANTKGLGERRAKELKKAYNAVVEGSTEEQFQQGYQTVRNAATFIRDNVLAIPDEGTLQDMPLVRLQKLANAWGVGPATGADLDNPLTAESLRESLIEGLNEFAEASPQARDAKALELVLEALNKNDSTIMNYYRGAKQDRTIVTERENVPPEIRKLLGEYEDIPLRAMITIARQAEFRARNRAFNELLQAEYGTRILSPKDFTGSGFDPSEWVLLKGPGYGALEGMRVRKDLAQRVEDSAEVSRTFDQVWTMAESRPLEVTKKALGEAVTGWAKFASAIKAVQLVWNVGNAAFNFLGGPFILMANGNFSPKHTKKALSIAWDLINSARSSTAPTQDSEKVIRAGITDSAFMGEIRAVELEQLRQLTLEGFASESGRKASKVKQAVRGGKRMWREAYAMADVTWKIANFLAEEQKLQEFYKAEGVTKTAEQIEREAAWRTNLSNFSYKRVPNLLKVVEKSGLTYVMPYIYETVRANVGSVFVGVHDLKMASAATTPEGKRMMTASGIKRITGSLMALGMAQYMATQAIKMVAEALGQTDDEQEEWVEDLKAMLPDYKRFSDYVYMGRSEDGKPVLFELSRLDPFGPVTEFFRMAVGGAEPEEMLEAVKGMWINNPYGSSLLSAFFGNPSSSTRMERIQPGFSGGLTNTLTGALDFVPFVDLPTADAASRRLVKAVDALFPSMPLNMFDPNNKNAKGDEVGWIMTNMMGVKVHNVDPATSTQHVGYDFKNEQKGVRDAFVNFLKTSTGLTDNEILGRYTALQEQEAQNYEKLERQYNGLLALDYTEEQALKMMRVAGLSEADLAILYSGGYRPQYSGIVNFKNLERSLVDTVSLPNVPEAKKKAYVENLVRLAGLVESGQIPARSE